MEKTINILITGSSGFIGKNLVATLKHLQYNNLMLYDVDTPESDLNEYLKEAQFVFHLAGVNRPDNKEDFMKGNFGFTSTLLNGLKKWGNQSPMVLASSIQAILKNPYGESKKAGEDVLIRYGQDQGIPIYIYRFPNVFGKWSRPFYNSAIATFCHQVAHQQPLTINDKLAPLHLVYIDDVVQELLAALEGRPHLHNGFGVVEPSYHTTVGEVADIIQQCGAVKQTRQLPDLAHPLVKKLYATYVSFLPQDQWVYPLTMHQDARGSFTEIIRTLGGGQVSINVAKPGIEKGHHWHHTKHEKFIVVSGEGIIRFRHALGHDVHEVSVNGNQFQIVEIPPGYVHAIANTGKTDLITVMWASEKFDEARPDTYPEKVK